MKTCPFCAEEIQEAAIKCKHCGSDLSGGQRRIRVETFIPTKKGAEIDLRGCEVEQVADAVERFFLARQFKREAGDKFNATYGIGSAVGRALAGGLVTRNKYGVRIARVPGTRPSRPDQAAERDEGVVQIIVTSLMTGLSGSLVGVGREQVQRRELITSLQTYLLGEGARS